MLDFGLKQNHKCATSVDKKQNWIIFNRLSVIQNQYRRIVVGHPVLLVGNIAKHLSALDKYAGTGEMCQE